MVDFAANYGNWLAFESPKIIGNAESVSIYVAGARSVEEVFDIVVPLAKKLRNGVTVWSKVLTDKSSEASGKVKFKRLKDGEWDLVIFSPYMMEASSTKSIHNDLTQALTLIKRNAESRVLICVPKFAAANPISIRGKM